MYGSGPLQSAIPAHPAIKVMGFVQPEQLGALYRDARIFALPSNSEAWGLVVHEAALSGCQLLLSDAIGSAPDLATHLNAELFKTNDFSSLVAALLKLAKVNDLGLVRAQAASIAVAQSHGPQRFATAVHNIVGRIS